MMRQMLLASLLVGLAMPAAAQNKCDAGKLKCMRNNLSCLIKVHVQSQKTGLPPDTAKLQKCMDKFDGGAVPRKGCFAKLEAKQDSAKPETLCSKTGDAAAAEADIDAYVTALLSLINATTPSTTTTTTTTLPAGDVCCHARDVSGQLLDFCTITDSETCTTGGLIGTPIAGNKCGGAGCVSGTPTPGNCCSVIAGASIPCAEPVDEFLCSNVFGGTIVPGAVCEATGCRVCKATGVECSTGSECCSKTCLAVTIPKKCL
jgi:hypothetical protein